MEASKIQIGGNHYKNYKIQPAYFSHVNGLGFLEGSVVKRVCRHRLKDKEKDIKKAIHELMLILEYEYGEKLTLDDLNLKNWDKNGRE